MGAADGSSSTTTPDWWAASVGYQIYIRSFADSDGDGVGDLVGITEHLDHLQWLGIDAIWITPCFPSPGADHGYDVSDYREIDPLFGDLAQLDSLIEQAHRHGIRVILDIVPNHTSNEHPWFLDSRTARDAEHRDFYLWRDPAPDGGPPNNWVSHFGGPAWTLDEATSQYYCHLFLPEQPDLNWRNPAVVAAFEETLRFWCERGIDGFRIDVAHALVKDAAFRDNPQLQPVPAGAEPIGAFLSFDHRYDLEQDESVEIFEGWNRVVDPYDAVLIGEVATDDVERTRRYVETGNALHRIFFLRTTWMGWNPAYVGRSLRAIEMNLGSGIAWATSSHDQPRPVTRFGGGETGRRRSLVVTTLTMGLGGMPFLYQGQELGLDDGAVDRSALEDPVAVRNQGAAGRDGCRTPMPWDEGPQNGFTAAEFAWLRSAARRPDETAAVQRTTPDSSLHRHRELIRTYHALRDLAAEPLEWLTASDTALAVRRGDAVVAGNLAADPVSISLPAGSWGVEFDTATQLEPDARLVDQLQLGGEHAVMLRRV